MRIVAWLLAIAVLAERAAVAPHATRFRVLWAAQQADAVVREFIAGSTWNPAGRLWSPAVMSVRYGNAPADAMNLALALRALAFVVQTMAAQIRRHSRIAEAGDDRRHANPPPTATDRIIQVLSAAFVPVELCDTS